MAMTLPFSLPDWLPAWGFLLLAIPVLLFVLAFLLMPFSVFGVKSRLEAMESQLDALTEELRNLNFRARGMGASGLAHDTDAAFDLPGYVAPKPASSAADDRPLRSPPTPVAAPRNRVAATQPQRASRRTEPRLD
jgi:hypothetical protein